MALIFPPTPSLGDTYTDDNSVVWQYNGTVWNVITGTVKKLFNGVKLKIASTFTLTDTSTAISWDTEVFDTGQYFNIAQPTRITIPQTGYYLVNTVAFADSSGAGYDIDLKLNGSSVITTGIFNPNQSAEYYETLLLNEGDYLELFASDNESTGGITNSSFFEVIQLGLGVGTGVNPSAAFSGVRTSLNPAFNVTSTPTAIAWTSTEFDTNANALALTYWSAGAPSRLTVKSNGYFSVQAYIQLGSAGQNYTITLRKNGTTTLATNTGLSPSDQLWIEETYQLVADDYIEILASESGGSGTITTDAHLELIRQGF